MRLALLTGADDPNYAVPLAAALATQGIRLDFIGNDDMAGARDLRHPNIKYFNLRGSQDHLAPSIVKILRILRYYLKLVAYTLRTDARVFHILWLNKFDLLDRTVLNMFYKLSGKKLVYTAHNVNSRRRDRRDTWLNRASLKTMYRLLDHIFVHTEPSRDELVRDYDVRPDKITVIPFGLNTYMPDTLLSKTEARARLGVGDTEKLLLFFGQVAPYKGLDILIEAMSLLGSVDLECRLLVAGTAKYGYEAYWRAVKARAECPDVTTHVMMMDTFIADADVPIIFRAADVLVLPYREIYQSGPLSLAYRFGVPVIATRVGAFDRDVIPNVTGLLCEPEHPGDLALVIERFFRSALYLKGGQTQKRIEELALQRYSWQRIGKEIVEVYVRL